MTPLRSGSSHIRPVVWFVNCRQTVVESRGALLPVMQDHCDYTGKGPWHEGPFTSAMTIGGSMDALRCRRFCDGQSTNAQQRATTRQGEVATRSTPITCGLQNSIEFNNH